ncbi:uncharacterized protein THITE_2123594 [Thermothielavioides terrestris NRRL 8126]|jgi:hypothetical protein|uniref:BHLH domain-containing protein n=1 Tax=Thermothielavioides terrestris (strain ATCC 38088 / NRRL 8126) TaxID=578455 RepID=G2RHN9_THETT|nr:uncharacterized protein THITE_2123594 [Thermothielavioides terrestris NRRL 8126]AEO71351.1 hypothetical protein THITE_2123594 [Thermothielavioides terrestris NRRL 8126]
MAKRAKLTREQKLENHSASEQSRRDATLELEAELKELSGYKGSTEKRAILMGHIADWLGQIVRENDELEDMVLQVALEQSMSNVSRGQDQQQQ